MPDAPTPISQALRAAAVHVHALLTLDHRRALHALAAHRHLVVAPQRLHAPQLGCGLGLLLHLGKTRLDAPGGFRIGELVEQRSAVQARLFPLGGGHRCVVELGDALGVGLLFGALLRGGGFALLALGLRVAAGGQGDDAQSAKDQGFHQATPRGTAR